jgi:RNA polymerase sigma factor (sigma-70 family)
MRRKVRKELQMSSEKWPFSRYFRRCCERVHHSAFATLVQKRLLSQRIRYAVCVTISIDDDRVLVDGALKGDARSWNAIVSRYGGLAFATARKVGLSRDEAEDVSQTVFTALVRSLATLRDGKRLGGWILVAARREAWRVSRLRKRMGNDLPEAERLTDDAEAHFGHGQEEEQAFVRRQVVGQAFAALDERCRELLRALFLGAQEPDYAAVAARFDLALNSVGPIRNRCLRRMLDLLKSAGFEPSEHGFAALAEAKIGDGSEKRSSS